jgi:cellulose synthase/poly-beta-1,6-N-acetylglucosamine synthase-like glycosyltransferase
MLIVKLLIFFYSLKILVYTFILEVKKNRKRNSVPVASFPPLSVDVILPMYNEDPVVIDTINNLLQITYCNFNIIAIDHGSTDDTLDIVTTHFRNHPKLKIIHQENRGMGENGKTW